MKRLDRPAPPRGAGAKSTKAPRVAKFVRLEGFQDSYDDFCGRFPKVAQKLDAFIDHKKPRPPKPLPHGMRDHALSGRLAGFRQCHLDGDACLVYKDAADTVSLYLVVDHADFEGPRERATARRLGR